MWLGKKEKVAVNEYGCKVKNEGGCAYLWDKQGYSMPKAKYIQGWVKE